MTTTRTRHLRIADVARSAGITTSAVRYYERVGVLPAPDRADNGYRRYDDRTVERLQFVGRAKQLGCSLDEIVGLVAAWDGGECGPVQDRLRVLVAAKTEAARTEIVELTALVEQLGAAAATLERHRPAGPCDDDCGCVSSGPDEAVAPVAPVAVSFGRAPAPIACTLDAAELPGRLAEWQTLLGSATARTSITDGVRVRFAADVDPAAVARLAAAERSCCGFMSFRIVLDHDGLALEVTAPAEALEIVHALIGAPS